MSGPLALVVFPIVGLLRGHGHGQLANHGIGCGACVAACKNASAMLFVSAKVSHLALLPQGQPEAKERVKAFLEGRANKVRKD